MRFFRCLPAALAMLVAVAPLRSQAPNPPTELVLTDGSRIKGRVVSVSATDVTVMADFGVIRLELAKLTPDTKAKLAEATKPDTDALLRRISELEARVAQLQQENEQLRRQALAGTGGGRPVIPSQERSTESQRTAPGAATAPVAGVRYSLSSTGKRHNSTCRYFGSGRACGPADGIPCKICGG